MTPRAWIAAGLLAFVATSELRAQDETAPRTDADRRILAAADAIEAEVAAVRARPFKRPVAKQVYSREQLAAFLDKEFAKPESLKEVRDEELLLRAIGFLPADVDLLELYRSMLTSQIGGFYDPEDHTLRCISTDVALVQRIVLVHEIYHALQDQYVPLESFLEREAVEPGGDDVRARQALVEGDAQYFTMSRYLATHPEEMQEDIQGLSGRALFGFGLDQALAQVSIPPYFLDQLSWPYMAGAEFVEAVFEKDGWAGVDRAFESPPSSSEQIMHPAKYLDGSDPPKVVTASTPAFGAGHEVLLRDTVGENWIAALLTHFGKDAVHAKRGSEGWGGDEATVLRAPDGSILLVWKLTWDSERDGSQFFSAWLQLLRREHEPREDEPANFVGTIPAGATEIQSIAGEEAPASARFRGAIELPEGTHAVVAERTREAASWLLRRGADVVLLRGIELTKKSGADLAAVARELFQ